MTYLNGMFSNGGYVAELSNHCTQRIFWSSQKEQSEIIQVWEQHQDGLISSSLYQLNHIIPLRAATLPLE